MKNNQAVEFDMDKNVSEKGFVNLVAMVDCSRNAVRTVETLKTFMRQLVCMGYTGIWLYMEDVYEIPEEPYFGYKRGRYSQKELKEISSYAKEIGLKCVPTIQTLAHLNGITRWFKYGPIIDTDDILLVDEPQTYTLIEKMFKSLRECFDGDEVHIGMDEANRVGLGKYLAQHGYTNRSALVVRHLQKVVEIAAKYGFTKPIMWNDMFIRLADTEGYAASKKIKVSQEILDMVPKNIQLTGWRYYSFDEQVYLNMISNQKMFNRPVYLATGAITWLGFAPMNKYSIKQNTVAIRACKKMGVKNYAVTIWGDDGAECSLFACLPTLAYVAAKAKGEKNYKEKFEKMTGIAFDKFLRLDSPNEIVEPLQPYPLTHASRYMLFNDCLQGLFDSTVNEGDGDKYKSIALKLGNLVKCGEFGYIFNTLAALSRTLYYKYELTVKTRKAYKKNDRAMLEKIVKNDYKKLLKHLDEFYEAFRYQWYKENKPYGFEVQDYRIGGLKQRLLNGKRIIEDYLAGKIEKIDELEEEVLSVLCKPEQDGKGVDIRPLKVAITANVF